MSLSNWRPPGEAANDAVDVLPLEVPGREVGAGVARLDQPEAQLVAPGAGLLAAGGAVSHGQGVAVLYGAVEDDEAELADKVVVVVGIEPVPGSLFAAPGAVDGTGGVEAFDARASGRGQLRVLGVDGRHSLPGQQLGVVVGVEVVYVDFEAALVDDVGLHEAARLGGGEFAVVAEPVTVAHTQEEVGVADVVVVPHGKRVDLRPAPEGAPVALAFLMAGDGRERHRPQAPLGANSEQTLVLLVEGHEAGLRQGEGGVAGDDLLEDVVLVPLEVELDLVGELVLEAGGDSLAELLRVLIDADVDRLADAAFHGELRFLFHRQGRKLRRPSGPGADLPRSPLALAPQGGGMAAVDPQAALVADEAAHRGRRRKRDPPLEAAALPGAAGGGHLLVAAHCLPPLASQSVVVPQVEVVVEFQGHRGAAWKAGGQRGIMDPVGVDGDLPHGKGHRRFQHRLFPAPAQHRLAGARDVAVFERLAVQLRHRSDQGMGRNPISVAEAWAHRAHAKKPRNPNRAPLRAGSRTDGQNEFRSRHGCTASIVPRKSLMVLPVRVCGVATPLQTG